MPFNHDSTGVDPDDSTILLVPDGEYTLKIHEAEEQISGKGNNMIQIKCHIVNLPDLAEAEIWHWVVFLPKDQKGAGISVMFRKAIGVPYGGDDIVDADDWVGKKFQASVIQESYKDKKGTMRKKNKIETFSVKPLAETVNKTSVESDEVPF